MKYLIRLGALLLATVSTLVASSAMAQSNEPKTPEGKLAAKAGPYLASAEYIKVFKQSKCAYALKKKFPTLNELLVAEVLPAFTKEGAAELKSAIEQSHPTIEKQAKEIVGKMIYAAQKEHDEKTGCGVAAGLLAGIGSRTQDEWNIAKKQYGAGK